MTSGADDHRSEPPDRPRLLHASRIGEKPGAHPWRLGCLLKLKPKMRSIASLPKPIPARWSASLPELYSPSAMFWIFLRMIQPAQTLFSRHAPAREQLAGRVRLARSWPDRFPGAQAQLAVAGLLPQGAGQIELDLPGDTLEKIMPGFHADPFARPALSRRDHWNHEHARRLPSPAGAAGLSSIVGHAVRRGLLGHPDPVPGCGFPAG